MVARTFGKNLLNEAVRRNRMLSGAGVLELLFTWLFRGLVYPQIWEDPEIDMEALAITPECHIVAIASGGCNILSYLIANPARITAVDLNKAHVALNCLKLAAARRLPGRDSFYRFFGAADEPANVAAYWRFLAPWLDQETRRYWERRPCSGGDGGVFRCFPAMSIASECLATASVSGTCLHVSMALILAMC